jgi:hypothetical protein
VFYDAKDALRAALEQPARPLCKGIPRRGCNYLAPCDTVCNKCGEIHHHHQMVAQFEAAKQPEQEPVAWANINKHGDITHTSNKQMRWARTALYTHPPRRA